VRAFVLLRLLLVAVMAPLEPVAAMAGLWCLVEERDFSPVEVEVKYPLSRVFSERWAGEGDGVRRPWKNLQEGLEKRDSQ